MLHVSDISKRYGDTLLFEHVNFTINRNDHIALIGPNGSGKSTLLRILIGQEQPDSGSVRYDIPTERIGYLPQGLLLQDDLLVSDLLLDPSRSQEAWLAELQRLAETLAVAAVHQRPALEQAYAAALEQLSNPAVLEAHQVDTILSGLGLSDIAQNTPVGTLSGGQKTRLGMARLLLTQPDILLLDEPTNHLDITALEWLEGYLATYRGATLIVSHDRAFLERTSSTSFVLGNEQRTLSVYPGSYSDYVLAREREEAQHWQRYNEQQERIGRLESAIQQWKGQASRIEGETINFHYRKRAKKVARLAVIRQRRLERLLNSEERLDKPVQGWQVHLEFGETQPSGQDVLTVEGLAKSFGDRVLFQNVNLQLQRGERIVLVGPNGAGKTTFFRLIVGDQAPSAGSLRLGAGVRLGYFGQEQETLEPEATPLELVQQRAGLAETEARNFLHFYLFAGDDVFTPIGQLSYGERARLALGMLVLEGCNLLLLDEPVNHLDIPSRERFEQALEHYEGTVLMIVHDRYLIERFATGIWGLARGTIRRYPDLRQALAAAAPAHPVEDA
ncbi:MAG: ribosomal protection-like ABC-F family protein [Anaerolineae bacterium]|jgi:ATP-binding cassette subfamily F protein 3|nr:ABC-F family ATP-binding cassette domain-containing protein [Chloroflexota bacterium]